MTTLTSPMTGLKNPEVEELTREIEEKIARLRSIADEPVEIRYGVFVSFELRPIVEGDRLNVYRDAWGCTNVNYTHEGLILDVCSEFEMELVHTAAIGSDQLEAPENDEASQGTGDSGEQGGLSSQRELICRLPAVAPDDLLTRLTPIEHSMGENFQEAVGKLIRPYMAITSEQYHAILMRIANSDVVEFDGIQMTFGSADGGYALMALSNRVPTDGLVTENAKAPAPGG